MLSLRGLTFSMLEPALVAQSSWLRARNSVYNSPHAPSALAQDCLDCVGDLLGANLLETIRSAELSVLLRSWQPDHPGRALVRKRAAVFLAGGQPAGLSEPVHDRCRGSVAKR